MAVIRMVTLMAAMADVGVMTVPAVVSRVSGMPMVPVVALRRKMPVVVMAVAVRMKGMTRMVKTAGVVRICHARATPAMLVALRSLVFSSI